MNSAVSMPQSSALSSPSPFSQHLIVEFYGACELLDVERIAVALKEAAHAAGATVLESKLHKFGGGGGVTGVVLLAESHISIHTWPEYGYAAIDVFMCGDTKPELSVESMKGFFKPDRCKVQTLLRGQDVLGDL